MSKVVLRGYKCSSMSAIIRRTMSSGHLLNLETLNQDIEVLEYAVRALIPARALQIEKELANGVKKPFTEVIRGNLDDCHAMGQIPITFIRQGLALLSYPKLLNDPQFPEDVKNKAKEILTACRGHSVGSYSESTGVELIRKYVAKYIEKRDGGIPSDWNNIFIRNGASGAIKSVLNLFECDINGKKPGVMIPIPQYPLYPDTVAEFNMHPINYYLDESKGWELNISELQRSIDEARKVCIPRVLVVINPGNPTGQVLPRKNIEEIIRFAHKEKLFMLADEVYQDNVYAEGSKFYSFKKVITEMGQPYDEMELASFMSCSKGYTGECGLRGGCVEIINMCSEVKAMYVKLLSASLCSSILGQAAIGLATNPPQKGDPSYEQFISEKSAVLDSLKLGANIVTDTFNSIDGMSCNTVQGAMYAFPQIKLPPKAIETAKNENKTADFLYALELLESEGVCIVPGSTFGQQPGTFHFRTTILAQPEKLKIMLKKIKEFHTRFIKKYS